MSVGSERASATTMRPAPRGRNPFDDSAVQRGEDGRARYADRPASLVHMLRASVQRDSAAAAVAEVSGRTLSYGELWDGADETDWGQPLR